MFCAVIPPLPFDTLVIRDTGRIFTTAEGLNLHTLICLVLTKGQQDGARFLLLVSQHSLARNETRRALSVHSNL